jgi:retron-type reverse transcriptase
MKTYRHLYPQVYAFDNLLAAFYKARKGKRSKAPVARFEYHLEREILQLERELRDMTYRPGPYRSFYIFDPKKRKISAAPFRDRVVHHALCHVIQPMYERRFIFDSYANRIGKGTHKAMDRCTRFLRVNRYVLKCDIVQYFPSVDHQILRSILAHPLRDPDVVWLIERILESGRGILASEYTMQWFPGDDLFAVNRPRGLPIGNLTSQLWANVYLNELDQFVKRELKCRCYVRYVDDFLLFHDEKQQLHAWKHDVAHFLEGLRLRLHPTKSVVFPTRLGVDYLGFRHFSAHRKIRRDNVRRFIQRLRGQRDAYQAGLLSLDEVHRSLQSWIAHAGHGDTYRLRAKLLHNLIF